MEKKEKCWHTDSYFIEEQEIYYCPTCGDWSNNDLTADWEDDYHYGDPHYGLD